MRKIKMNCQESATFECKAVRKWHRSLACTAGAMGEAEYGKPKGATKRETMWDSRERLLFARFQAVERSETETHPLCGWRRKVTQIKSPIHYNRGVQPLK